MNKRRRFKAKHRRKFNKWKREMDRLFQILLDGLADNPMEGILEDE